MSFPTCRLPTRQKTVWANVNKKNLILSFANTVYLPCGQMSCGLLTTFKYYSSYLIYMFVNCVGLWMVGKC